MTDETNARPLDPYILLMDLHYAAGIEAPSLLQVMNFLYPAAKGGKVLEICCGSGKLGLFYALRGCSVVMADIDEKAIAYAQRLRDIAAMLMVSNTSGRFQASVKKEDVFQMSFSDREFDFVFSEGAHEHWPEEKRRISEKEMLRVLKPGGILLVAVPNVKDPIQKKLSEGNEYHWHTMEDKETLIGLKDLEEDFILLGLQKLQTFDVGRVVLVAGEKA